MDVFYNAEFTAPIDLNNVPSVANHASEMLKAATIKPASADPLPLLLLVVLFFIFKG